MQKFKKIFGKVIYGLCAILGTIILERIIGFLVQKYGNWLKDRGLQVITHPITGWVFSVLIILTIVFIFVVKRNSAPIAYFLTPEPGLPEYNRYLGAREEFRVKWKIYIGHDFLGDESERLWVDDPLCPHCDYQLDRDGNKWFCVPCNKKFRIPKSICEDTKEKMIKFFKADLRIN